MRQVLKKCAGIDAYISRYEFSLQSKERAMENVPVGDCTDTGTKLLKIGSSVAKCDKWEVQKVEDCTQMFRDEQLRQRQKNRGRARAFI